MQYLVARRRVRLRLSRVCLSLCCFVLLNQTAFSQQFRPPPKPAVHPLLAATCSNDTNLDRIDDQLLQRARRALVLEKDLTNPQSQARARRELSEKLEVELIFKEQITQAQN